MTDLLVRLYDLPASDARSRLEKNGIAIRRALGPERDIAVDFAAGFSPGWGAECATAFGGQPVRAFVAARDARILGFACYDATARGFFGPTGVAEAERQQGIGEALLLETLGAMVAEGYAYAIIGWAGPIAWYKKRLGAIEIPGSDPGIYRGLLRRDA